MRHFTSSMGTLVAIILICLVFPRPAYAYLDPGTGSYVLQLVLAALLGAAFAVKLFWTNIRSFFTGLVFTEEEADEGDD